MTVRVRAIIATTHWVPKYGGFRLTSQQLEQMGTVVATGGLPMRVNHDLERPLDPQNLDVHVEKLDDGEFGLVAEFDVDQEAWAEFDRERLLAGAPGGFSFTIMKPFATRGTEPFGARVYVEYGFYDEQAVAAAAGRFLPDDLPVQLNWLYQFSAADNVRAIIDFTQNTLAGIPGNLLSSYLYDFINWMRVGFVAQSRQPVFEFHVTRTPSTLNTAVKITANSDDGLRQAMRELPDILRAEGEAAAWSEADGRWRRLPPSSN
jgi:hypothetical protein